MKKQTIAFTSENSRGLKFVNEEYFRQSLMDFGPGVKLKITVEHYFPQRSPNQNRTWHWWADLLAEHIGMDVDHLKQAVKYKFLKRPVLDNKGNELCDEYGVVEMYVPSTADLDKAEFVAFMDDFWRWSLEFHGYELPLPDSNMKINFQEEKKKQILNK